jgi:tRNA A37 threonylcarbamoyladenosine dehydratase
MSQSCPVLTPAERQVADILSRADQAMLATVRKALEDATKQAAEELQAIGSRERPPAYEYFAAVAHHHLFLLLCGADPETCEGGDPETAARILDNGRKISAHYWAGPAKSSD